MRYYKKLISKITLKDIIETIIVMSMFYLALAISEQFVYIFLSGLALLCIFDIYIKCIN